MRVRPVVAKHKRVRKIVKKAKGFRRDRRLLKSASELILRSEAFTFVHRKNKKREMKKLWIVRINAAARNAGMKYSTFVHGLKKAGVVLSSKALAQIAYEDEKGFNQLVESSKSALSA